MMWYEQLVCGLPPPENRTFSLAPSVWLPNFELDRYANSARYVCDTHFTRRASLIFCRVKNKWLPSSVQFSFFSFLRALLMAKIRIMHTKSQWHLGVCCQKFHTSHHHTARTPKSTHSRTLPNCTYLRVSWATEPTKRKKKIPKNAHQLHVRNTL